MTTEARLSCPACGNVWRQKAGAIAGGTCPRCGHKVPPPPSYVVGLDLGQAADYTAVTILEHYTSGYDLRYLHRYDVGTPYPRVAASIAQMLTQPPLDGRAELVVDYTGVGRPVVDMLIEHDLSPIAVTITGGDVTTSAGNVWRVPKRDLVAALVVLFQNGGLRIARQLPLAGTLTKELLNFKMKVNVRGHDSYEAWREGEHDDLVLAAALAAWWSERGSDTGNFLAAQALHAALPPANGLPTLPTGAVVTPVDQHHPDYAVVARR